jgi:lipoprotein-releasing system permease protein
MCAAIRLVAIFSTGNVSVDSSTGYISLNSAQILAGAPAPSTTSASSLPTRCRPTGCQWIEGRFGYKAVSWQEANQAILEAFVIRNVIMYTVVAAILLVAGFGIYNIISTITYEKTRDIAIMKSLGFPEADMRRLFVMEGLAMGWADRCSALSLGAVLTYLLGRSNCRPWQRRAAGHTMSSTRPCIT